MWGSSFADFAKKAQELQEQASSLSTGELFNLDAMQSSKPQPDSKQTSQQITDATPPQETAPKPSFSLPTLNESSGMAPAVATPKAPPAQKGKLKIVKKKSPKLGAVKLTTTTTNNKMPELSLTDSSASPGSKPEPAAEERQPNSSPIAATKIIPDQKPEEVKEPEKSSEVVSAEPADSASTEQKENIKQGGQETINEQPAEEKAPEPPAPSDMLEKEATQENGHSNNNETKEEIVIPEPEVSDVQKEDQPETPKALVSEEKKEEKAPTEDAIAEKQVEELAETKKPEEEIKTEEVLQEETTETAPAAAAKPDEVRDEVRDEEPTTVDESTTNNDAKGDAKDKVSAEPNKEAEPLADKPEASTEKAPEAVTPKPIQAEKPTPTAQPETAQNKAGPDSDQVMQQFTAQLQRLEANFEMERKEMQLEHKRNIEQAMAAKDQEMEQLRATMKEKDIKVRDLKKIKEGNELRMDSLKREVQGIKELLQQRDNDIDKVREAGKKEKEQLEKKIRSLELEHGKTKQEVKSLKSELENSRGKLGETSDEYTNLKSRVKVVAGELKERRAECRELKSKIEELEEINTNLDEKVSTLDAQLSDRDRSGTEKDEEADNLRAEIEQLKRKVKEKEKNIAEQEDVHEKNLASYKKKAQNSLAVANARAAAAIQSKEEAELEARAARTTADATLERGRLAEANGQKAMAEAKAYYKEMEQARNAALKELEASKSELESAKRNFSELKSKLDLLTTEKERLGADNAKQVRDIETERAKASSLQYELAEAQRRTSSLQGEITQLRVKLTNAESAAADAKAPSSSPTNDASAVAASAAASEDKTSKATIMMLQKQLQEANQTIGELKDALENAAEMNEKPTDAVAGHEAPQGETNGRNSAPLFYAMEKQAELNTARNEINRLASLYADVQSEKVEAEDALKTVRKELAEEKAKLQRYEKLGSASEHGANGGANGGKANGHQPAGADSGRTNIEYLKNIMMSYLNAKTLAERKALVPVIGAVLCLTPDEQTKAIQNIEASGGMEGFSTAFFETLGSKVGR